MSSVNDLAGMRQTQMPNPIDSLYSSFRLQNDEYTDMQAVNPNELNNYAAPVATTMKLSEPAATTTNSAAPAATTITTPPICRTIA